MSDVSLYAVSPLYNWSPKETRGKLMLPPPLAAAAASLTTPVLWVLLLLVVAMEGRSRPVAATVTMLMTSLRLTPFDARAVACLTARKHEKNQCSY